MSVFDFCSYKYILAPMVDQSELAWRMLSRKYNFQLCYTPMIHAAVFIRDYTYRKESMQTCGDDRPLIVQFCANDPNTFVEAAKLIENQCDAVDLNLGCPQSIAKRGHYGAFLQDDWNLIHDMVSRCAKAIKIPVTCKIRIFEEEEKTVRYAQMLEQAGAKLLSVHGRTREQKGINTGIASWQQIQSVCKAVSIPVYANGNIQYFEDIERCITATGAAGVMIAEGSLHNPVICTSQNLSACDLALEYLQFAIKYPGPLSFVRGHIFKLLHYILEKHEDYRMKTGTCKSISEFEAVIADLQKLCSHDMTSETCLIENKCKLPYWICQPYVRPDPNAEDKESLERRALKKKRPFQMENGTGLSKNKQKKLLRNCLKSFDTKTTSFDLCPCNNPMGSTCTYKLCRSCCRSKCYQTLTDCQGHRMYTRKQRELQLQSAIEKNNDNYKLHENNINNDKNIDNDETSNSLTIRNSNEHCRNSLIEVQYSSQNNNESQLK